MPECDLWIILYVVGSPLFCSYILQDSEAIVKYYSIFRFDGRVMSPSRASYWFGGLMYLECVGESILY